MNWRHEQEAYGGWNCLCPLVGYGAVTSAHARTHAHKRMHARTHLLNFFRNRLAMPAAHNRAIDYTLSKRGDIIS